MCVRCMLWDFSEEECRVCKEIMRIFASFSHSLWSVQGLDKLSDIFEMFLVIVALLFGIVAMEVAAIT